MNRQIQLTEQDLHFLVENAVKSYLMENGMEEGLFGGLGTIGSKFKNRATAMGQNFADNVGQKWGQAKDAMGRAANAVGQAYNNVKNTYQVGSINQDAQKAVQNAIQSLNNLVQLSGKLQGMGQNAVIGQQTLPIIQQCIKTLNQVGGRFKGRRTMAVQ